jgi:hypothetical protein
MEQFIDARECESPPPFETGFQLVDYSSIPFCDKVCCPLLREGEDFRSRFRGKSPIMAACYLM